MDYPNIHFEEDIIIEDARYRRLFQNISDYIKNHYDGKIFYMKLKQEDLERISTSFLGSSNRFSGRLIGDDFEEDIFVWAYNDAEYSGQWLFGDDGPIFGERIIS